MPSATVYTGPFVRGAIISAFVKYYDLDVEIKSNESPEFATLFPLKKIPALVGPKGYKLTEIIAILFYLIELIPESKRGTILGSSKDDLPEILKWVSLGNTEFIGFLGNAFKPLLGKVPYNKKVVDASLEGADVVVSVIEERIKSFTFLVGERISLADFFVAFMAARGFGTVWGSEWRSKHVEFVRWFKTVFDHPLIKNSDFAKTFEFREKPIEFVPPKKEKKEKKQQPKKEAKKEAKPEAAAAAPATEEPKKAKHPLELLGKSSKPINDWKVKYSNEDTREKALPWFWNEFYNSDEWSLWKVDYKYNDELTLTFMSNNLVGGFFNRLSGSIKYIFGCLVVYGENNNNGITGAFLVRGQDFEPAFDVAPDWESYSFTKLDPTKEEDKDFINNSWAWDEPMIVNGEKREIADGKVCK